MLLISISWIYLTLAPTNTLNKLAVDLQFPRGPTTGFSGEFETTSTAADRIYFFSQKQSGLLSTNPTDIGNRRLTISRLPKNTSVGPESLFYVKDSISSEFVFTNKNKTAVYYGSIVGGRAVIDLKSCSQFSSISAIHLTETAGGVLSHLIVADKGANTVYSYVLDPSGAALCTSEQTLSVTSPEWILSSAGSPATVYVGYRSGNALMTRSFNASTLAPISAAVTLTSQSRASFKKPFFDSTSSELLIPIQNSTTSGDEVIVANSTLATTTPLQSCRTPTTIATDYEGASRYRYIFCPLQKTIQVRDTSNVLLASLSAGSFPRDFKVGSDGVNRYISITQTSGQVVLHQFPVAMSPIVPTTATLSLNGVPNGIQQFIGAAGAADRAIISLSEENAFAIINLTTQAIIETLYLPRSFDHQSPISSTVNYFVSSQTHSAYGLTDLTTGAWTLDIYPVGQFPVQIAYRTNRLYTLNRDSDTLSIVNLTSGAVSSLATGDRPTAFDFNTAQERLWAINETSQSLSVFDITTGSEAIVAGTPLALGFTPKAVKYRAADNTIFVMGGTTLRTINRADLATVNTFTLSAAGKSMELNSTGVTVSSPLGHALFNATRTTNTTLSLSGSPTSLVSNGTLAVTSLLGQKMLVTSSNLDDTTTTFQKLFSTSTFLMTFSQPDKLLKLFPYSGLVDEQFPFISHYLEIDPDLVNADATGTIWASDSKSLTLQKISSSVQLNALRNKLSNRPEDIVPFDAQDKIYIAHRNLNAVSITDAITGTSTFYSVCQSPRQLILDTSTAAPQLIVRCMESDLIGVITLTAAGNYSSLAYYPTGSAPSSMVLNAGAVNRLYVTNSNSDSITVFNSIDFSTVSTTTVASRPIDIAINTTSGNVFVAHEGAATITQITALGVMSTAYTGTQTLSQISVNSTSGRLFALSKGNSSAIMSPTVTLQTSGTVLIDQERPYQLISDSSTSKTFISYPEADVVRILNESGSQTDIAVGSSPRSIALSSSLGRAFISNFEDDSVTVINTSTNAIVSTVNLSNGCGPGPSAVMTVSGTDYLYVVCQSNDTIELFSLPGLTLGTPLSLRTIY